MQTREEKNEYNRRRYQNIREKKLAQVKQYDLNHKLEKIEYHKQYWRINKDKLSIQHREYLQTEAGKITNRKHDAKHYRQLGWTSLNEYFDGCEGHHISKNFVDFSLSSSINWYFI